MLRPCLLQRLPGAEASERLGPAAAEHRHHPGHPAAPIADCGLWIADSTLALPIRNPQAEIRNYSFSRPRIVSAIHHPTGPPFGRPVIPPLFVGRLRHDRRHLGGDALVVQCHVGDVAGVGMPLLAREHILGDDLHAHSIEVRPAKLTRANPVVSSPTWIGSLKSTLSAHTVTQGPRAWGSRV